MENKKTKYKGYVYTYSSAMGKINRKIYMANLIKKLCLLLIISGSCVESILIYYYITKRKKAEFFIEIIYVFLTIFLYLLKCPQSLIL